MDGEFKDGTDTPNNPTPASPARTVVVSPAYARVVQALLHRLKDPAIEVLRPDITLVHAGATPRIPTFLLCLDSSPQSFQVRQSVPLARAIV